MTSLMTAFAAIYTVLRLLVLAVGVLAAVGCLLAWLVRTRRISPFSPVARVARRVMDPFMAPMERRVVRSGGLPSSAPWWALAAVVVGGIVLLTLVQFVFSQIALASVAVSTGGTGVFVLLLRWTFAVLRLALIVRVISSWVGGSPYSKWFRWSFVLTEPMLAPLRRIVPTLGMIDITPIIAFLGLGLLESLLLRGV